MTEKIIFLDKEHNIVLEKDAEWKVIHQYNKEGQLIEEKWVNIKEKREIAFGPKDKRS